MPYFGHWWPTYDSSLDAHGRPDIGGGGVGSGGTRTLPHLVNRRRTQNDV